MLISILLKNLGLNLVVIGLPPFIHDHLNRKEVYTQSKLISELSKLKSLVNRQKHKNIIFKFEINQYK